MPPRRGSLKRGLTERFHLLSAGSIDLPTRQSGSSSLSHSPTIASSDEPALLERIRARVPLARPGLLIGVGDDAAVLRPDRNRAEVITTDMLVEDVHFRRAWSSASDIGYKAVAVNVSDLAAMGAEPAVATLSFALPATFPLDDFDALAEGAGQAARDAGLAIAGGNLTRSPGPVIVDVMAIGYVHPRKVLRRDGAAPGDEIYLTGSIGAGAAGLKWLEERGMPSEDSPAWQAARRACRPESTARHGVALSRAAASRAAIDLSDGLADGIRRLTGASQCGARIEVDALPIDNAARWIAGELGLDLTRLAFGGGDDYELLFTVPSRFRGRFRAARAHMGRPVTRIGLVTPEPGIVLTGAADSLDPASLGFDHFSR